MTQTIKLSAGATEEDFRTAVWQLSKSGGTLVLAKDSELTLTKTHYLTIGAADVTIDLNGSTIHQKSGITALAVTGVEAPMAAVKLGLDAAKNTTVTYDKVPAGVTVGAYVKVTSDDRLPGDHIDAQDGGKPTLMGQAAKVVAINGNTVVLEGQILEQDQYKTNVRAFVYAEGQFTIKNGAMDGPGQTNNALLQLRNLNSPVVEDLTFTDATAGVKTVNGVHSTFKDIVGLNVGVTVQSSTSYATHIDGMYAEGGYHAVMVHGMFTPVNDPGPSRYGADIGLVGSNIVAYHQERSAFDFHSESRNGTYVDSMAFETRMYGGLRGIGNSFKDGAGAGNDFGVQLFEYGIGDGRDALIDNLVLRETKNYTFIVAGNPKNNTVRDSSFESQGVGYRVLPSIATMTNTSIKTGVAPANDILVGTSGDDKLLGGKGMDILLGGDGNDYLWGGAGIDTLTGGNGHDRFAYHDVSEGGDIITDFKAGVNGDVIDVSVLGARLGWRGDAYLAGGHVRVVQSGLNTLVQAKDGGEWTTLATLLNVKASAFNEYNVQSKLSDVQAWLGPEPVTAPVTSVIVESGAKAVAAPIIAEKVINGTAGDDWFKGDGVVTRFIGSAGNDGYTIDNVNDRVVGETADGGIDSIWASVSVDLNDHAFVENLRLTGDASFLVGRGNALNNVITGTEGANLIAGGLGNDTLWGKGGADTFYFAEMGAANVDNIWDFDKDDKIALSKAVFTGLDANNDSYLDAGSFTVASKIGAGAVGTKAQIIYNDVTGVLSYDADGAGGQAAQDIAFIGKGAKGFFDANDILLV